MNSFETQPARTDDAEKAAETLTAPEGPETGNESREEASGEAGSEVANEEAAERVEAARQDRLGELRQDLAGKGPEEVAAKSRELEDARGKLERLQAQGDAESLQKEIARREQSYGSARSRVSRWFQKNVTRTYAAPGTSELNAISQMKRDLEERNRLPGTIEKLREDIARLS